MLLSLILYGSRARGDHRQRSDVDLLGVVESASIHREVTARGASFYHYPSHTLISKAESGDLFLLHIVEEGKVLHDTLNFFDHLKSSFQYKKSYRKAIQEAQAIIRFFDDREHLIDKPKCRKRLVWAMRTVLIARAAEEKNPIFSSASLEQFSEIKGLKRLIDNRNTVDISNLTFAAREVEDKFGISSFQEAWPASRPAQRKFMKSIGGVAEDTLKFLPEKFRPETQFIEYDVEYPI